MVLTALAFHAEPAAGSVVARASVRSLAAELELDKDTVARALVRLRRSGLVLQMGGRFTVGLYRLTVPAEVIRFNDEVCGHGPRQHARQSALSNLQLAFLDPD
jgi:DNA-binding IclR family transcriptional regulator